MLGCDQIDSFELKAGCLGGGRVVLYDVPSCKDVKGVLSWYSNERGSVSPERRMELVKTGWSRVW